MKPLPSARTSTGIRRLGPLRDRVDYSGVYIQRNPDYETEAPWRFALLPSRPTGVAEDSHGGGGFVQPPSSQKAYKRSSEFESLRCFEAPGITAGFTSGCRGKPDCSRTDVQGFAS